jgi:uncharacterized protein
MKVRFEWDPAKASGNLRKHGVSFPTAARVFADPLRFTGPDQIVDGELRWRTIGLVESFAVLVVAHTLQENKDGVEIIRIISARRAERAERRRYEEEIGEV